LGRIAVAVVAAACASWLPAISPDRQDFVIVEGRIELRGWRCGTVSREGGAYFYVCDMPISVERVVFGQWQEESVVARFFMGPADTEDDFYTGPNVTRDRRGAAILWRGNDGGRRSFVLMPFPDRWCIPNWMIERFQIRPGEAAQLQRAGYPVCTTASGQ
jgi:hypothetical protein